MKHAPLHAPLRTRLLWLVAGLSLAACGGGGDGNDATANAPAAAPTPAPSPAPSPAPAPAPAPIPPLAATAIVLAGQTLGTATWTEPGDTATGGQGQPIDGVSCLTGNAYHVHAHLSIFKDGVQLAIPSAVGRPNTCNYNLHTHDSSGVIHIEAAAPATYTLGQFFSVWGRELTDSQVAEFTGAPIVVYLNDNGDPAGPRLYSGDIRAIEFAPKREITIQIGTPLTELQTYDWSNVGQTD